MDTNKSEIAWLNKHTAMDASEFIKFRHGHQLNWQELAELLGVKERTAYNYGSGASPIPDNLYRYMVLLERFVLKHSTLSAPGTKKKKPARSRSLKAQEAAFFDA